MCFNCIKSDSVCWWTVVGQQEQQHSAWSRTATVHVEHNTDCQRHTRILSPDIRRHHIHRGYFQEYRTCKSCVINLCFYLDIWNGIWIKLLPYLTQVHC